MTFFYQPSEIGPARTLIAVSGLVLGACVFWFPATSFLRSAGVLVALMILIGVRNPASTMTVAWISLTAAGCCVAGGFLLYSDRIAGEVLSVVGTALAVSVGVFHLWTYAKRRKFHERGNSSGTH